MKDERSVVVSIHSSANDDVVLFLLLYLAVTTAPPPLASGGRVIVATHPSRALTIETDNDDVVVVFEVDAVTVKSTEM